MSLRRSFLPMLAIPVVIAGLLSLRTCAATRETRLESMARLRDLESMRRAADASLVRAYRTQCAEGDRDACEKMDLHDALDRFDD